MLTKIRSASTARQPHSDDPSTILNAIIAAERSGTKMDAPDARTGDCGKSCRKRVITDARREQNRAASRAYRQRKKNCFLNLQERNRNRLGRQFELRPRQLYSAEDSTTANSAGTSSEFTPLHPKNTNRSQQMDCLQLSTVSVCRLQPNHLQDESPSNELLLLSMSTASFISTMRSITPSSHLDRDSALSQMSFNFSNFENPSYDPASQKVNTSNLTLGNCIPLPILDPFNVSMTFENPASSFLATDYQLKPPFVSDPYMNYISLSQMSLLPALLYNAHLLEVKLQDLATPKYCSPFYRLSTIGDDPKALLAAASVQSFPEHLQPTLPQILFPHHTFLDLLPFPALRARAITLAAANPPLLIPNELKKDIIQNGLTYRGARNNKSIGDGQPWDMRSWEAAPWFLKKWRLLISGGGDEVWKQNT